MSTKKSKAIKFMEKLNGEALTLGQILEAHRKADGFTMAEFAKKLGISVSYLNDLEKGAKFASPEKAAEYARVLGMSIPLYVEMAIQEQLNRAGMKFKVKIKSA